MSQIERNLVFICFGRKDISPQLDFRTIFEDQLKGANLARQGKLRIEFFVDEQIRTGSDWKQEIQKAIDRTRVAVVLEGSGLFTSKFVQQVEIPQFLASAQQSNGLQVFRIPVRPVASSLVPEGLKQLHAVHPIESPLSTMEKSRRDTAIGRIVDRLVAAFEGADNPVSADELEEPPFEISPAEKALQVFPDRILEWVIKVNFEGTYKEIYPSLRHLLAECTKCDPVSLPWALQRPFGAVYPNPNPNRSLVFEQHRIRQTVCDTYEVCRP